MENPTHVTLALDDANQIMTLLQEVPFKYALPVVQLMQRAQPMTLSSPETQPKE